MNIIVIIFLILVGILLLMLEFAVIPGVTVAGIGGALMLLTAVFLAFKSYGLGVGFATLGFVLLKYISMRLVGYIFLGQEKTRVGINTYFSILSVAGLLLYPVIGLKIYFLNGAHSSVFDTISLIISTLIILLIAVKIFLSDGNLSINFLLFFLIPAVVISNTA